MVNVKIARPAVLAACLSFLLLLSGCLYPEEQTPGQGASVRGAVGTVQDAVNRYKEATGLLPIQNADASVPVYEKFKIDFAKMKRMGYVESIPKHAFESGGKYVFLIIDEETNPRVKLLDVTVYQEIANVQKKVDEYRSGHGGENPAAGEAYPGFRYLDFGKLGMKQPDVLSMYTRRPLELMVDEAGRVYADYGIDVAEALKKGGSTPAADEDLRERLVDASDFVPVKSPVYRLANGSPQAVPDPSRS
ncbi:hypothetical protein GE107_11320 [Cohnella sp. CFH 77786]|uniref:DUF3939 domain-containing protein n=1 Tax=Cohnella sp. CFH 77786 TaxID=2662265 RepID=UPI001C60F631|nr:DUF3939 domain-containing protein [Cohnella sp. CFH 77786]MBW5446650.1 hypothetical protein [Cohnella sp. CFH 77786]